MKSFLIITALILASVISFAQRRTTSAVRPAAIHMKTSLGGFHDSTSVTVEAAGELITKPLIITDAKNTVYTLSSYRIVYTRKGVTEDDDMTKVMPASTTIADRFTVTPLPELWSKSITEDFGAGDQLYFFDVIVKDPQGRLILAPSLKIKIR